MKGRRLPRNAEGKEGHMMVGKMMGRKATLVRLAVNWLIVHKGFRYEKCICQPTERGQCFPFVKTIKIKVSHLKDSIHKLRNGGVSIDGRGLNTDDSL
eukprot:scaffold160_cov234-Chaetoceros_neogracile.AAC.3